MNQSVKTIDTGTNELLCEVRDRVAVITLNRPDARNSLSNTLTPALRRMIKERGEDPTVGAILLTGAGTAFCAGGNVKGMANSSTGVSKTYEEKVANLRDGQRRLTGALLNVSKPTIAALPGPAAGAGLALALACDIRIASKSAFVTTAYAKIGLSGDYGTAWLLTRLVGTARARELMFFAEKIDAKQCELIGLVNRVVPDDRLRDEAFAMAKTLADGPTVALSLMKETLNEALTTDFLSSLDQEAERMIQSSATSDHKEAVQSFVAKRRPVFAGR